MKSMPATTQETTALPPASASVSAAATDGLEQSLQINPPEGEVVTVDPTTTAEAAPSGSPASAAAPSESPGPSPSATSGPSDKPGGSSSPSESPEVIVFEQSDAADAGTLEPPSPPASAPAKSTGILPIVIAVIVVLAAAAVLGVVLSRRRKEAQARRRYPTPSTRVPRQPSSGGRPPAGPGTVPVDADTPRTEQIDGGAPLDSRYRVGFAQTVGSRDNQEDSYCISNWMDGKAVSSRGLLAAVADGIGGMSNGQIASGTVVRNMCARFERQNVNMALSDRLLELAAQGQQDVLNIVQRGGNCGTTLVSVLIRDGQMVMLSVGDSRVSLYRSGMLLQLNREHVMGKESDEYSMLNHTTQNTDSRKRKAITAYLGKPNLRLIDRTLNPMKLMPGDRILLMSDGVFGPLSDDEIIAAMQAPPDQAAQAVIRAVEAKRLPHQDNATIVIVEML